MAKYFATLTETGEAKMARTLVSNTMVPLTEMAVGDGGIDGGADADVMPSAAQRALVRERHRRPLNRLVRDEKNPSIVIAEIYLPEEVGGWWSRELGLYDEDGELFAVANVPPSYKPVLAEGSGRGQFFRMMLIHKAAGNIVLKIDPAVVVATREYVDEQVTAVRMAVTGDADKRYASKESVAALSRHVDEVHEIAADALPRSGGDVSGPINLKGSAVELQLTDTQQPITLGRFRLVSSGGMLIVDRNTAGDGSFSTFVRACTIDGNGNVSSPAGIVADLFMTRRGVNLPAYNSDGRGFLEFGGDTVIWRLFTAGPTGNLILGSYNVDGTNRHQPFYIDYASGKVVFGSRPSFNGATPWDSGNLPNPLTTDGGSLSANRGLTFGVGYGRGALQVSSNGTDSIGGAFVEWDKSRSPALQIDCPWNQAAYMGIRWTQWGTRHLGAIDCYAGGSDATLPFISMHVGAKVNAFTFNGNGDMVAQGAIHTGSGGGILAGNGNVYMSWAGQWLSEYLSNLNGGKAGAGAICQWNTEITEFGGVSTGSSSGQADLPAPYVLVGLRNGFYTHYLRAVQLRNQ
ncbi:phage tail protein [Ralstonia wenshanensis]|uniref:phage tail protein n=1 Tax=Ralstonia wenshanensis TaxID=2842456 RepID=UPI002AADE517|nr:phage tail protein [Ralstonia wenshanensis]MDY7507243.1 phage tail protein [Ralstonia wenshanensis]